MWERFFGIVEFRYCFLFEVSFVLILWFFFGRVMRFLDTILIFNKF